MQCNTQPHTDSKSTHTTIPTQHSCLDQVKQPQRLILNSDKPLTLFTLCPVEYNTRLNLQINNTTLDMHSCTRIPKYLVSTVNSLTTH